jgi:flagellin
MLSINPNLPSTATTGLNNSQRGIENSVARLSSGLRVNSAKDDAAGLAIATRLEASVRGNTVATRNVQDGISYLQVYEGGMRSITDNLQRMRELAVQASTGTLNDSDRLNLNAEFAALRDENSSMVGLAKYNGKPLYQQTAESMTLDLQIGSESTDTLTLQMSRVSTLVFPDGSSMPGVEVALASGVNLINADFSPADILTVTNASNVIDEIDQAIGYTAEIGAKVGSYISRLESVVSGLDTLNANETTARGRIVDADFAKETAQLTRQQIIQQAATAMTAQANASPKLALQLLG